MIYKCIYSLLLIITLINCQAIPSRPITNSTTNQQSTIYDVVIVGSGLTGLSAARQIQRTNPALSVIVLEARGQVGGRVRYATMQTRNGVEFVDIGSQFISPDDKELLDIINGLNVSTYQQLTCGESTVYQQQKRRKRDTVVGLQQQWMDTPFEDILNSTDMASYSNVSVSQLASGLDVSDADSINRLMQTFFDAPGEQVSAVQLALTCSSQNATSVDILRRFGHGRSLLAKGGMNEVMRRMADGVLIEYNQRVTQVNDAAFPSIITTSSGRSYRGRQVIVAVPIPTLQNIQLIPSPETPFQQLIQNYGPAGHAYYFTMTFQRSTWRLNGKSGKVIYTSQNGPLVWLTTFDTTYASSCDNTTNASSLLWGIAHFSYEVPFETRRRLYTQAIMYSMRFADFSPLDVSDVSFTNDDFARGSIPSFRLNVPVEVLKYLNDFHTIYQNVHISTADIASKSLGTMNGAVHAGHTVADYVLSMLTAADNQSNGLLRDSPVETSTPYVYHTSSHYPPGMFVAIRENDTTIEETVVQRDQGTFKYETSTHYPVTEPQPETTTYRHFSFGNLGSAPANNETSLNDEPLEQSYDAIPVESSPVQNSTTTFVYSTSTVVPPIGSIETTTYQHFSNGNLPANSTRTDNIIQRDAVSAVESAPVNTNYVYSTSTHYPISAVGNNIQSATPSSEVIAQLQTVSGNANNSTSLQLATSLNSLVQTLLQGLRLR